MAVAAGEDEEKREEAWEQPQIWEGSRKATNAISLKETGGVRGGEEERSRLVVLLPTQI